MNIFEDFFNKKMTVEEFVSLVSGASDDSKLKEGLQTFNPNSPEEYLTQIFTHIMLKDASFRKSFLKKLEIADGNWQFDAERFGAAEINGEPQKGEMDVFGEDESTKALLIIENKLESEIGLAQPRKYAKFFDPQQDKKEGEKDYSEYTKYVVVLTKFSGLITYWDSRKGGIKEKIITALQNDIDNKIGKGKYICKHIYWYEIYNLLKDNFEDKKIQQELLAFLEKENLDKTWYMDMGCPFWRKDFNDAYKAFAQKHNLPKSNNINKTTRVEKRIEDGRTKRFVKPNLGIINLSDNTYFAGARIQGARAAEQKGNCYLLQLVVNGKNLDLSKFVDNNVEKFFDNTVCSDMILEAFGKK